MNYYDHLGNTRVVYQAAWNSSFSQLEYTLQGAYDYYPYGKIIRSFNSNGQERYLTTQHERDEETISENNFGTGYTNARARLIDHDIPHMLGVDKLAHLAPAWSPYRYAFCNPVMYTDPTGNFEDWVESADGDIYWDENATSQETTKEGETYLGKAVVVFEGSENEKLGKGDNLFGEGANLAKATVYGPKGPDDIKEYDAYTMSSDPSKYGTIADGKYNVFYDAVGKSGVLKSNWAVEGRGAVAARNGFNPAFPDRNPGYLDGVFIHRSNNNGYAGGGVSRGCPLICPSYNNSGNGWDEFNQQLEGVSKFLMIMKRDLK